MTVVTEVLDLPSGQSPRGARVYFRLAGTNGAPVAGQVGSVDIVGDLPVPVLANGSYSVTLYGNDAITPTGTRWKRFVVLQVGPNPAPVYVNVPSTGGPYTVGSILDEAPASVASSALTTEIAARIAGDATNATAITTEATTRATQDGLKLAKASNLSDVANTATALSNLGGQPAGTSVPLPSGTPTVGQVPVVSTASPLALAWGAALGLTPTAVKVAGYTAAAGDFVPVDTTSAAVTVTLPTAPANGAVVAVQHVIQGATYAVTVARGGADVFDKVGGPTSKALTLLNQGIVLQYEAATAIWHVIANHIPLTAIDLRYTAAGTTLPLIPHTTGRYYYAPGGTSTVFAVTDGRVYYVPFDVTAGTIDWIGVSAESTVGGTGSKIRIGIYNDNGYGGPGSLLLDCGYTTSAPTTNGIKNVDISQAVGTGRIWIAVVGQGAPSPNPTLRMSTAAVIDPRLPMFSNAESGSTALAQNGITSPATLPDPAVPTTEFGNAPLVRLRFT